MDRNIPDNVIYISRTRPLTDYVIPVMSIYNSGAERIIVKSRGSCNNSNLSLSQYLMNKAMRNMLKIAKVDVWTEQLKINEQKTINVTCLAVIYERSDHE